MNGKTIEEMKMHYNSKSVKQVLFEYGVPISERNLKLTGEEMQSLV
ncbi:MAG TPA: hypothetical protein VFC27_04715 [Anaerovoracaceae bacterium]|nr:hypothetical protein [Anaerovoracaceae bacterium]